MKILYADTGQPSLGHVSFNEAMVATLNELGRPTIVFLNKEQIASIEKSSLVREVTFSSLDIKHRASKISFMKKFFYEVLAVYKVFRNSDKGDVVFFGGMFSNIQWLLPIFTLLFPKRAVLLTLHGELASLEKKGFKSWFTHKPWVKISLFLAQRGFYKSIVLEERIKKILNSKGVENIECLKHPYIFKVLEKKKGSVRDERKLVIAYPGTLCPERGGEEFFNICKMVNNREVVFKHVGGYRNMPKDVMRYLIEEDVSKSDLDRSLVSEKEYAEEIRSADFLVYIYDDTHYKFASSGALLDAVKHGIPILATKSDVIDDFFLEMSFPGFVFDDAQGLIDFINNEMAMEKTYEIPVMETYENIKKERSPEMVSKKLEKVLEKV